MVSIEQLPSGSYRAVVPMSNNVIRVDNSVGTTHVTVDVEGYIYPG